MLTLISVILIHSAPCSEIAQANTTKPADTTFTLKGGKTITVKKFEFVGNTAVTTEQLERLANFYLNRPLSESNLAEIKVRIAILYKSKGYPNVEVTVPATQKEGTLTFAIKEGKKQS